MDIELVVLSWTYGMNQKYNSKKEMKLTVEITNFFSSSSYEASEKKTNKVKKLIFYIFWYVICYFSFNHNSLYVSLRWEKENLPDYFVYLVVLVFFQ